MLLCIWYGPIWNIQYILWLHTLQKITSVEIQGPPNMHVAATTRLLFLCLVSQVNQSDAHISNGNKALEFPL